MDCFTRLETLIDADSAEATDDASILLRHLSTGSRATFEATDEFLIELIRLAFLVEAGLEAIRRDAWRASGSPGSICSCPETPSFPKLADFAIGSPSQRRPEPKGIMAIDRRVDA